MNLEELEFLRQTFDDEKRFAKDGYYRLREKSPTEFELAYLYNDSCGTTTVHPQITLEVEGEKITPRVLIDLGSTPTKYLNYSAETATEMETALKQLVAKFYKASETLA